MCAEKKFMTVSEVADLFLVSKMTVIRWIRSGKLKAIRTPSGYYRIPVEEVQKYLQEV